jgi:hypothetical protein
MRNAGCSRLRSTSVRVALATLLAAVVGGGIGTALARDPEAPRVDSGPPRVGLASGVARLPLPAGWRPLNRHSSLPGLRDATAVQGAHSMVALDIRSPEDPSLLPEAMRAASAGDLPAPRLQRLDSRGTWRYEIPDALTHISVVAMALPTTGGVVTIACRSDTGSTSGAREDCGRAMSSLRLDGASELAPAPEAAARIVLPDIVGSLNRKRRTGRRALGATRSPGRRGEAARRLAAAYRSAAERLLPLAAGDAHRLTGAFAELARDHLELAAASRRRDVAGAQRAGAAIEHGERRLQPLLAAVSSRAVPRR